MPHPPTKLNDVSLWAGIIIAVGLKILSIVYVRQELRLRLLLWRQSFALVYAAMVEHISTKGRSVQGISSESNLDEDHVMELPMVIECAGCSKNSS
jgi:hypothetical protein